MSYDENSFLQGIAVGKSLKGVSAVIGDYVPIVWNDEGEYDHFYIDFRKGVTNVTETQFMISTRVKTDAGDVAMKRIEHESRTVIRVTADYTGAEWLSVSGISDLWMRYDSGAPVGLYSAVCIIDGKVLWSPGFIAERAALPERELTGADEADFTFEEGYSIEYADEIALPTVGFTTAEDVQISYT